MQVTFILGNVGFSAAVILRWLLRARVIIKVGNEVFQFFQVKMYSDFFEDKFL